MSTSDAIKKSSDAGLTPVVRAIPPGPRDHHQNSRGAGIFIAVLAVLFFTGCGKTQQEPAPQPEPLSPAILKLKAKAGQGDVGAQRSLGQKYSAGEGVSQNLTEAAKWYRQAAEQGDDLAQLNLGKMYREGKGVPRDNVTAYAWLFVAAIYEMDAAAREKESLASELTPGQLAKAQELSTNFLRKIEANQRKTTGQP